MGVTTIRALVNMTDQPATLKNRENNDVVQTVRYEAKKCSMRIPHCPVASEFPGHHLRLDFFGPQQPGQPAPRFIYSIWQQNISSSDWVRFREYAPVTYQDPNIDPQYEPNSRGLLNARNGSEYVVSEFSDALLVIDERLWVILVQI